MLGTKMKKKKKCSCQQYFVRTGRHRSRDVTRLGIRPPRRIFKADTYGNALKKSHSNRRTRLVDCSAKKYNARIS